MEIIIEPKSMVFVTGLETATRISNVIKWCNFFINNYGFSFSLFALEIVFTLYK